MEYFGLTCIYYMLIMLLLFYIIDKKHKLKLNIYANQNNISNDRSSLSTS